MTTADPIEMTSCFHCGTEYSASATACPQGCPSTLVVCDECGTEYDLDDRGPHGCPLGCDGAEDFCGDAICGCCGTEYAVGDRCPYGCSTGECLGLHDVEDAPSPESWIAQIRRAIQQLWSDSIRPWLPSYRSDHAFHSTDDGDDLPF